MKSKEVIATLMAILAITTVVLTLLYCLGESASLLLAYEEAVTVLLEILVIVLHVLGGGVIFFGALLLGLRYFREKIKEPFRPIEFLHRARFLTVGLEIFIGAEIIHTATARTVEGFVLLFLTIASRSFIALFIYLEKKWGLHQ